MYLNPKNTEYKYSFWVRIQVRQKSLKTFPDKSFGDCQQICILNNHQ